MDDGVRRLAECAARLASPACAANRALAQREALLARNERAARCAHESDAALLQAARDGQRSIRTTCWRSWKRLCDAMSAVMRAAETLWERDSPEAGAAYAVWCAAKGAARRHMSRLAAARREELSRLRARNIEPLNARANDGRFGGAAP